MRKCLIGCFNFKMCVFSVIVFHVFISVWDLCHFCMCIFRVVVYMVAGWIAPEHHTRPSLTYSVVLIYKLENYWFKSFGFKNFRVWWIYIVIKLLRFRSRCTCHFWIIRYSFLFEVLLWIWFCFAFIWFLCVLICIHQMFFHGLVNTAVVKLILK